ncbi:SDR family oxidoreductase [Foetidibacter luteolus]|uniref:SDR family oxidoreductase n=1 Tax=Foetidibacter luteolus TaxID=2608880 RepID=UPI00129ABA32|nr:SDR family oxidoreductase [Foetidibacter luteolus]
MKILITGANGFLGQHLTLHLAAKGYHVLAVSRGDCRIPLPHNFIFASLDITEKQPVDALVKVYAPDVIVHAAAISKPDECEKNRPACLLHNVTATQFLLHALQALPQGKSQFIYISTDFVFGENGPHAEEDEKGPLNFYGESKLQAERLVEQSGLPFSIVRPVFIYGAVWQGLRPSFLHWVKNNLEKGQPIKVVSDQQRTPTFVEDLCKGIESIIENRKTGVYHLAGKNILSPWQMAMDTAAILGLDAALIENVTSQSFAEPVKRAKKSGLKIDKAIHELDYNPVDFKEGIRSTFNIT